MNILRIKYAPSWLYLRDYTEMHCPQNIKCYFISFQRWFIISCPFCKSTLARKIKKLYTFPFILFMCFIMILRMTDKYVTNQPAVAKHCVFYGIGTKQVTDGTFQNCSSICCSVWLLLCSLHGKTNTHIQIFTYKWRQEVVVVNGKM